jgi:hypothetical protein
MAPARALPECRGQEAAMYSILYAIGFIIILMVLLRFIGII